MKTKYINNVILSALLGGSAMGFSACSDSFFDRYNSDTMQMETYLTNDSEIENILLLSAYSTGRCDYGQRTLYRRSL